MTQEEKAKAYDEAIEKLRYIITDDDGLIDYESIVNAEELENIFPGLKISDYERIRKSIIRCLKGSMPDNDYRKEYIAWLEKQGKQKSAGWSEEDDNCLSIIIAEFSKCAGKSVSKDDWMRCNDFLNSLKDRVQPQPKQEWSGEDNKYLIVCKNALRKYQASDKWDAGIISRWLENKLKAPQNTWKPSDEQMTALADALSLAKNCGEERAFDLRTLYEQLEKLKGD